MALRAVDEYGIISDEVPVAQWIERVPPEHETAGSSPVGDVLISFARHTPVLYMFFPFTATKQRGCLF